MADLSDVEQTIVNTVAGVIYPNGSSQPSALPGAAQARIFRGWPEPASMDADMAAGIANVTVFSRGGTELNTTRYPIDYQTLSQETPTVTATVLNNTVTLGGANNPAITQYVTLQIGPRTVVSYAPLPGDNLASIAIALASLISSSIAVATASGPVITVSSGLVINAIVGTSGIQIAEVRRQRTQIQIGIWTNLPSRRDAISILLEPFLAQQTFLTLPDTSACRFRYHNTLEQDNAIKVLIYRRDLIYTVEYITTVTDTAYQVTSLGGDIQGSQTDAGTAPNNEVIYWPSPEAPVPVNSPAPFHPHVPY